MNTAPGRARSPNLDERGQTLVPIAQGLNSASGTTTGEEIDEFFDRLRTNANPASVTGYKGISFWRADLKTGDMWSAIQSNVLGDVPGPPNLTLQPQSRTVTAGSERHLHRMGNWIEAIPLPLAASTARTCPARRRPTWC